MGVNPNASEIGFGYDIPYSSYYYQDGLLFGWDGSVNYSYVNGDTGFPTGVTPGDTNLLGENAHIIDRNATYFPGTTANRITYFNNPALGIYEGERKTFSVWAKGNELLTNVIFTEGKGLNTNSAGWLVYVDGVAGQLRVGVGNGTAGHMDLVMDTSWGSGTWKNGIIVFVNNPGTGADYVWAYVNGVLKSNQTINNVGGAWYTGSGESIGRSSFWDYNGTLDEIHIWNKSFSASEVLNMYNLGKYGNLKLQTRVGNSWNASNISGISRLAADNEINWSAWSSYYIPNGSSNSIQNLTESYRYLQYMALFETLNTNLTPVLMDVVLKQEDYQVKILNTQPFANFSLTYPTNVTWTGSNHTRMNWTNQSDLDGDILHPVLNIYNNSGSLILNSTLYNTSSIFGNSPSTAYYPEGLKLLWDGSDLINKVNTSHVATKYVGGGELTVGAYTEANGNFTDSHTIDRIATQFDSSSDYIIFPNIDSLIGTYPTEFTISQWVKTEKWTSSVTNYYWIFYNGTPFTGLVRTNFAGASGQIPYFSLYNSSGGISTASFSTNFGPSSRPTLWDFMVITYDGVNITYYFNYTKVDTAVVGPSASIEGYGFALGNANNAILDIDEVAIFNRSLSGSEIASLYELQRFAFDDGNYTWKLRMSDNSTSNDDVYENALSDWSSELNFQVDTLYPDVAVQNITANRTTGQVIVNNTSPVTYGENLTLRFNLTDSGIGQISSAWIYIWDSIKNAAVLFWGWLVEIGGGLWEITIPALNATYGTGQINYTLYVNDTLNNTFEYDSDFYVETGYPFNASLISPLNQTVSTNRTPLFQWNGAEDYSGLDNYTVQVDNDVAFTSFDRSFTTQEGVIQYQVLGAEQLGADTAYYWRVYYCDQLNYCNTSEALTYTVDTISPTVTLNSPANGYWSQDQSADFIYTPTDVNLDYCILYGNWTDGIWRYNTTDLTPTSGTQNTLSASRISDGRYDWNVICVDSAGNNNTLAGNRTFGVDTQNPKINLTVFPTPIEFGVENSTVNFTIVDVSLNYSVINISYPDGTHLNNASNNVTLFTTNLTKTGNYTMKAYAIDFSGRENTTYENLTVRDTIKPSVLINYPVNNSVVGASSINFTFNVSDLHSIGNITITINGTLNSSTTIAINSLDSITYMNLTGFFDQQNTMWNISVYDNSSNVNISETRIFSVDLSPPLIVNVNKTPEPSYPTSNVTLNATVTDLFLHEIWVEGNWSGSYQNYTNSSNSFDINSDTDVYSYNITWNNFTNQESVIYRWCANDTNGNSNCSSWGEFKVQNRVPLTPVWRFPAINAKMLNDNYTEFDWDDSTDLDLDNVSYELEVYNSTKFNSTYMIFAFNTSYTNYTLPIESMPPVGDYYLRIRANDSVDYNSYNYSNFSIVYSTLQIVAPTYDQVLRIGNSYNFNITEMGNGNWVNNISVTLQGSSFTSYLNFTNHSSQGSYTSYNYSYDVPSVQSQYVTVTAYGWNGSIGSSANVSEAGRFRITVPVTLTATYPTVSYFCPDYTYVSNIEQANVTVRVNTDLSVLLDSVDVYVYLPNGTVDQFTPVSNNEEDFIPGGFTYEHNFSYSPKTEGSHTLSVQVRDINYPETGITVTSNASLVVANNTNITFTGEGITNFTINDICSSKTVFESNSSVSFTNPSGYFDLELTNSKLNILVENVSLSTDHGKACAYQDLSESIAIPTNTRAIDQYNFSCSGLSYGANSSTQSVNMTYNYTSVLGTITYEENLKFYKCNSQASCSWTLLDSVLSTDNNYIRASMVNLSVFMVSEATTSPVAVSGSGGGGGGGGGSKADYDLDIIEPGVITVAEDKQVTTQIILRNTGGVDLYGIRLSADSGTEGLGFVFSSTYIPSLARGQSMPVVLTITRGDDVEPGQYDVNVLAEVSTPNFEDRAKVIINLVSEGGIAAQSKQKIEFAQSLLEANPICLELKELIDRAIEIYEEGNYEEAIQTTEAAINSCKDLVNRAGLTLQEPKKELLNETTILIIEIIAFMLVFYSIYYYYRRRRFKKKNAL